MNRTGISKYVSNFEYIYYMSLDNQERTCTSVKETQILLDKIQESHMKDQAEHTVVCIQMCTDKGAYEDYIVCIFNTYMDSVKFQNDFEYAENVSMQVYQVTGLRYILVKEKAYDEQCFRCYSGMTPKYINNLIEKDAPIYHLAEKLFNAKTALVCVK